MSKVPSKHILISILIAEFCILGYANFHQKRYSIDRGIVQKDGTFIANSPSAEYGWPLVVYRDYSVHGFENVLRDSGSEDTSRLTDLNYLHGFLNLIIACGIFLITVFFARVVVPVTREASQGPVTSKPAEKVGVATQGVTMRSSDEKDEEKPQPTDELKRP